MKHLYFYENHGDDRWETYFFKPYYNKLVTHGVGAGTLLMGKILIHGHGPSDFKMQSWSPDWEVLNWGHTNLQGASGNAGGVSGCHNYWGAPDIQLEGSRDAKCLAICTTVPTRQNCATPSAPSPPKSEALAGGHGGTAPLPFPAFTAMGSQRALCQRRTSEKYPHPKVSWWCIKQEGCFYLFCFVLNPYW